MKTTCYAAGCEAALVGEAANAFTLVNRARAKGDAWIAFMDAGDGLEIRSFCPVHSPPVQEAVKLLVSVFGEDFSHMHLRSVARAMKETPIVVTPKEPSPPTETFMPKVDGKPFRCEDCGSNCFHKPVAEDTLLFACNSCRTRYRGEPSRFGSLVPHELRRGEPK